MTSHDNSILNQNSERFLLIEFDNNCTETKASGKLMPEDIQATYASARSQHFKCEIWSHTETYHNCNSRNSGDPKDGLQSDPLCFERREYGHLTPRASGFIYTLARGET